MNTKIERLLSAAADLLISEENRELHIGERSRIIFLTSVTIAGGLTISLFAAISHYSGNHGLSRACLAAATVVFLNLTAIRLFKRYTLGGIADCSIIFIFYLHLSYSGGEAGSGVLWSMTYPLITLFLLGPVWGSAITLGYGAALGFVIFHPDLNRAGFSVLYSMRVLGAYFFIWIFALIYELIRRVTHRQLMSANQSLSRVTEELMGEKKQTDDILANVMEGIFLLSGDLRLGGVHSRHLERILGRHGIQGASFLDLLGSGLPPRDIEAVRDYLDLLVSGTVNDELLAEINPLEEADLAFPPEGGEALRKRIRFQFTRISTPGPYPIMGVAVDVTEEYELKRRLAEEEREHHRTMETLFQVVHVEPAMMKEFVADSEAELETIDEILAEGDLSDREGLEALYQSVHAIKGNAALLGLKEFADDLHLYEDSIRIKLQGEPERGGAGELKRGLIDIKGELDRIKDLIDEIVCFQTETKALQDSSLLRYSIEKNVLRESKRTGLPAAVDFEGFTRHSIPHEYRKLVKDVLVQFIRNSFAHGFEDRQCRGAAGKPPEGRISLTVESGPAAVTIRYSDDGRGLDPERLRSAARAIPELASRADSMSAEELRELIFRTGFSTSESASSGSGRGIGMTLAKERITAAGGKLEIRSDPGRYTEFSIALPLRDPAPALP